MFYTYVIKGKRDGRWYTGSTNDLRKRFNEHNCDKVFSTKGRGPFELIYYEACRNEQDARAREKYLKSGMGKRYLKNRLKRFLSLTGFTPLEMQRRTTNNLRKRKLRFLSLTGFTLVEILVAMLILATCVTGLFATFVAGKKYTARSKHKLMALNYARQQAEKLRTYIYTAPEFSVGQHDSNFLPAGELSTRFSGTGTYSVSNIPIDPADPNNPDKQIHKVVIKVSWDEPNP